MVLVDAHTHIARKQSDELIDAARLYGVARIFSIAPLDENLRLRERYPGLIEPVTNLIFEHRQDPAQFADDNRALLVRAVAEGVRVVKLWLSPRASDRFDGLTLDSPLLDSIFEGLAQQRLRLLLHVADPDLWFANKYTDVARYATKADHYARLEQRLHAFPTVRILVAHMGGHPEDLGHLGRLLDRYPNLSLDTSATRWMVRELGRQPEAARAFFTRYADRLLFGTDQVVLDEPDSERYLVRYWIHQMFWETDLVCELPIDDPDAEGVPMLRGINLPAAVLRKVYSDNAARWLAE
jgi:predicted TIM-barrel fold metal-dependent hydrolase